MLKCHGISKKAYIIILRYFNIKKKINKENSSKTKF